jgi:hypothetical protein
VSKSINRTTAEGQKEVREQAAGVRDGFEVLLLDFVEAGEGFLWFVSRLRSALHVRLGPPGYDDDPEGLLQGKKHEP